MACITCQRTKPILECGSTLTIGTFTEETPVLVQIKNVSNGYISTQEVITDLLGSIIISLNVPDISFFNKDSSYEIRLFDEDYLPQLITISSVTYECLQMSFEKSYNSEDESFTITNQIIQIN